MIMIKELLDAMPQKIGGFTKTIKTAKKKWQVGDIWYQQVLLMDETGQILADIKLGTYNPLQRGNEIKIIVGEIRKGEKANILYVDQYEAVSISMTDFEEEMAYLSVKRNDEVYGMIRHGLTCSAVKALQRLELTKPELEQIKKLSEFIMTGEIK